jgi:phage replication-related protein YjqB (UPF0714/DUF867 family)
MVEDKYSCYKDLAAAKKRGEDYDFECQSRVASGVAIIAPHGGNIEPWTDTIAKAIAGKDFSFYCFEALKKNGRCLHIKSHLFDEPTCEKLVAAHRYVVAIHGWGAKGERVCLGGRDIKLVTALRNGLAAKGIEVEDAKTPLSGAHPKNIANRGATGRGVQFELTMGFRRNAIVVKQFTAAVRAVLMYKGPDSIGIRT